MFIQLYLYTTLASTNKHIYAQGEVLPTGTMHYWFP